MKEFDDISDEELEGLLTDSNDAPWGMIAPATGHVVLLIVLAVIVVCLFKILILKM